MIYTIKAYWPNSTIEPEIYHTAHFADALEYCLGLRHSHQHTNIVVTCNKAVLLTMWGQPMDDGKDWP